MHNSSPLLAANLIAEPPPLANISVLHLTSMFDVHLVLERETHQSQPSTRLRRLGAGTGTNV